MSATRSPAPVVVGVDGSVDGTRAARFAALEARRRRTSLRVMHAARESGPASPGRLIVEEAVAAARHAVGRDLPVAEAVVRDRALPALLEASAGAAAVVLGRRPLGRFERMLTASTTLAVIARANCPVVSVPAEWRPATEYGRVVVGVDGSADSRAALDAAFEAASARETGLTVLHAWNVPDQYDAVVGAPVLRDEWEAESEVVLSEILAGRREDHPDVVVELELRYEHPRKALTEASAKADLVVVGRRGTGGSRRLPLGSVARGLCSHAHCPLLVVPEHGDESSIHTKEREGR